MQTKNGIVLVIAMAATLGAQAQGVYRSVGPDGKVTYSDQPPGNAGSVQVIRAPGSTTVQRPVEAKAQVPAPNASEPAARSGGAKQARLREKPAAEPAAAPRTADLALEKAVISVMGIEDLVQRTEQLCVHALPTSFMRYAGVTESWKQRNGAIASRARQALQSDFGPQEQREITVGIRARNEVQLSPVVSAPMAHKISWCDRTAGEIKAGVLDVHNKTNLSSALLK